MTLQIKVETVLLRSGTDLCTKKKRAKVLGNKMELSWTIHSVQGKKAEGKRVRFHNLVSFQKEN
jgi:hypothetical protein